MVETFITVKLLKKKLMKTKENLLVEIVNFKNKIKPQDPEKKEKKNDIFKKLHALFNGRERVLGAFES